MENNLKNRLFSTGIRIIAFALFPLIWFLTQAILFRELSKTADRWLLITLAILVGSSFIFILRYLLRDFLVHIVYMEYSKRFQPEIKSTSIVSVQVDFGSKPFGILLQIYSYSYVYRNLHGILGFLLASSIIFLCYSIQNDSLFDTHLVWDIGLGLQTGQ